MQNGRPELSLDETIECLTVYLDWMEKNAGPSPDTAVEQLRGLLGGCHRYLTVYRESLESLTQIREKLEMFRLQYSQAVARPQ